MTCTEAQVHIWCAALDPSRVGLSGYVHSVHSASQAFGPLSMVTLVSLRICAALCTVAVIDLGLSRLRVRSVYRADDAVCCTGHRHVAHVSICLESDSKRGLLYRADNAVCCGQRLLRSQVIHKVRNRSALSS